MTKSEELFKRAVERIPGGVNSPVRAYGAVGDGPGFIYGADGFFFYVLDLNL
jgi:glutamate-1-semialdehyde 2,1-aminomutase